MVQLLGVYLPLFVLMLGFYVGERTNPQKALGDTSGGAFFVVVIATALWVIAPLILLVVIETVEEFLRTLKVLNPFGQSVGNVALAFYFSKGRR